MNQLRLVWTLRVVSGVALLLAIGHLIFPKLAIDPTTVLLLAVAVLPWLKPVLASVELPGGVKLNFKETEKEAERVGLLAPTPKRAEPAYIAIANEDPTLALAGLRIEIERRLRQLAEARGLPAERLSIGHLVSRFVVMGVLSSDEQGVLRNLIDKLNLAVHGQRVDDDSVGFALSVGPRLLAALDEKVRAVRGYD